LLLVAVQTGLRISEMIGLLRTDVHLGAGAHVACQGKGRKDRITPLTVPVVKVLRVWLAECEANPAARLFPTRTGTPLSRDAIERRITLHAAKASAACATLANKNVTFHVLRHTAAMRLLEAGVDPTVIALWLGHEHVDTTTIYLHAHLGIKEQALARARMPNANPGRYRPSDPLLTFLESL
jgi:integrase